MPKFNKTLLMEDTSLRATTLIDTTTITNSDCAQGNKTQILIVANAFNAAAPIIDSNTGNIATNTTNIATNTSNISANTSAINTINSTLANVPVTKGGTGNTTQFTSGSLVFALANGIYGQDNPNLFWDGVNKRLGLGTNSPTATLEVKGSSAASSGVSSHTLIDPTISQSATAGYEALVINPTESSVGSGIKNFIRAAVGGITKATLTNAGSLALGSTSTPAEMLDVNGNVRARKIRGLATAIPTIAKGTGGGTTGVATVSAASSDIAGSITIIVGGTIVANATIGTVTFNSAYSVAPIVTFSAASASASLGGVNPSIVVQLVGVYISATSTTSFTLSSTGTLLAGTYTWNYHVIQPT